MDALDILTDLDHVIPYFQAIFSADEHRVIGYEIFARYESEKGTISIGSFFNDKQIPEEYRLLVDNVILRKSLEQARSLDGNVSLFINRNVQLLLHDHEDTFLSLLQEYNELGDNLNRFVLEISGDLELDEIEHLEHLLNYYRTYGIKVAMDKIGDDSGQLDRIGQLAPEIIKVNLRALRSTDTSRSFQDVLYTLSMLARKIGATLLFDNIEMVFQLQFAWKNGGRYYQGYYLQQPSRYFVDGNILKERLKKEIHEFISYEKKKLVFVLEMRDKLQAKINLILTKNKKIIDNDQLLLVLATELEEMAFRLYICDEDGFQKSPNIFKKHETWTLQREYVDKNWSWRPFFLENIIYMRREQKGILSDLYSDIETGELIRTFSYPINEHVFLFIDISYEYLYEQEK